MPSTARIAGATALVLSPLVYAATRFTWPAGSDGPNHQVVSVAAAHPGAWNLSGALEALWGVLGLLGAITIASVVTGRGRLPVRIGVALSSCAAIGMVANWTINAELAAQASSLPHASALAAYDATVHSAYLAPFIVLLLLGTLGGIVLVLGAVRARLVPWWVLAIVVVGTVGELVLSDANALGAVPLLVQAFVAVLVAQAVLRVDAPAEVGVDPVPSAA